MGPGRDPDRPRWWRRVFTRLSLRARLLLGLILVAALGVIVADIVVYQQIESYLVDQTDTQLTRAMDQFLDVFNENANFPTFESGRIFSASTPPGTYGAVVGTGDHAGTLVNGATPPQLPSGLLQQVDKGLTATEVQSEQGPPPGYYFTAGDTGGVPTTYRVISVPVVIAPFGQSTGGSLGAAYVATPITSLDGTLGRLVDVDLAVTAALLVVLGLLGYAVVRVGMRPLIEIEETAQAIAAGDLTRRVEREDERTEIGRLGSSLNVMLETIERAFSDQQASEDRLRQFLADASHELRTPVTSIRGYAELFRRGAADRPEDLALAMRRIEDESIRMAGLVDDLLVLARLDQGRPLEREAVDVATVVADAATDIEAGSPGRELRLELEGPLVVAGDQNRLHQVVANLLTNALRYTPPASPITIRARRVGDDAVIQVVDEGEGIAPEHLPHLFERFYRADPSRTRGSGGAGLGLSIVASIVEAHGGRVRVESELGVGSTFTVELPLASEPMREHAPGPVVADAHPRPRPTVHEEEMAPPASERAPEGLSS